jgi:hypothetical protein
MSPALHLVRVRDQRRRGLALVLPSVAAIRLSGLCGALTGLLREALSPQTLGLFVDGPRLSGDFCLQCVILPGAL